MLCRGHAVAHKANSAVAGDDFVSVGATGADIAASTLYCVAGSGSCPGSAAFKALEKTDEVWRSNTAPFRFVARSALVTSIGVEAYQFNQARIKSDGLGMLDATIDTGAMLPAMYGGGLGVVFSLSYAITDNALSPFIVPSIVDAACSITGNC